MRFLPSFRKPPYFGKPDGGWPGGGAASPPPVTAHHFINFTFYRREGYPK
jgi:hypothetical protein